MAIEFLYFDLGNVLLTFSNERASAQLARLSGVEVAEVESLLLGPDEKSSFLYRYERGDVTDEAFYLAFCRAVGASPTHEEFDLALSDMFGPIEPSLALVEMLAASGYRLGILSNTNPAHWRLVTDGRFRGLPSAFEQIVTSFNARSMKPEFSIFEQAIERANVPAQDIFFVDDRPENVEGARAAGLDAVLYRDHPTLLADLAERGIDP